MENSKVGDARHLNDEIKSLVKHKFPVAVDFDGTMVFHHYPYIGNENKPCVEVLKKWSDNGIGIILDTMRSGKDLEEAVNWCKENNIELYGVGKEPHQEEWTDSNKCYAVFSVDDRNLGVPLRFEEGERPAVDWLEIDRLYSDQLIRFANNKR